METITLISVDHNSCRIYGNTPKFSDKQVWANNADPGQTAPRGAV